MDTKITTFAETAPFVEALRLILKTEDSILEGFTGIYGEDTNTPSGGKTGGEEMFHKSGLFNCLSEAKDIIKTWIGTTFELGMAGCLEAPGDPFLISKKGEGVC